MTSQMLDGYMKKLLLEIKRHKRKKLKNDNSKYRKNIYGQPRICNIDFIKKFMQCH